MAIGWLLSACLWMAASCGPAVAAAAAAAAASTSAVVAASPCPEVFLPELSLEFDCSTNAVVPGGLRTFSGTLRNRGNVEVRNLSIARVLPDSTVTVRVQTSPLPGVSVPFSGDYRVPAVESCQTPVRVVEAGVDACRGQSVGAIGSLACPVATSPALSVAMACPAKAVAPGGEVVCSGTVRNNGDVTLRQVVVGVPGFPDSISPVLSRERLDPGESASFTIRRQTPVDECGVRLEVAAVGVDACSGLPVALHCPASTGAAGEPRVLRGGLTNTGNVLLVRAQVLRLGAGGAPVRVFGPVPLAPGESAVFAVPAPAGWGEDPDRDFVEALAEDGCRGTGVSARAGCQGPMVPPVPVLRSIAHGADGATLRWVSQPGTTYRLEYADGLPATSWIPLPPRVTATGDSAVMTDPAATAARRFYRVLVVSE